MPEEVIDTDQSPRVRVNQVYREYLNAVFHKDYYRKRHEETVGYARHLDFLISLGTGIGGGTGLGILADPRFAWLCGIFTAISLVLSIAKATYNWPGKLDQSMKMVELYSRLSLRYRQLVEDIRYKRDWNDDFEKRFAELRRENEEIGPYDYPHWDDKKLRAVQEKVKARIKYENWWGFERDDA